MESFLTEDLMLSFCREIMYQNFKKGHVIFYEGDIGKNFYVIIQGKVRILREK
jgi:CRP-like cAMP-binding protein